MLAYSYEVLKTFRTAHLQKTPKWIPIFPCPFSAVKTKVQLKCPKRWKTRNEGFLKTDNFFKNQWFIFIFHTNIQTGVSRQLCTFFKGPPEPAPWRAVLQVLTAACIHLEILQPACARMHRKIKLKAPPPPISKLTKLKLREAADRFWKKEKKGKKKKKGSKCTCRKPRIHHSSPRGTSFLKTFKSHLGYSSILRWTLQRKFVQIKCETL